MDEGVIMMPALAVRPDARTHSILLNRQNKLAAAVPGLSFRIARHVEEPTLIRGDQRKLWLIASLEHDPQFGIDGGCVLPARSLADLRRLAVAGVEVQGIVVAHEVAADKSDRLFPLVADGPRRCSAEVAHELAGPIPDGPVATRVARSMNQVVKALSGNTSALLAYGRARVVLDPILIGVIGTDRRLRAGQPTLWVGLTAWEW
jgi:hypothetical protein